MDPTRLARIDDSTWRIDPHRAMRVPGIIYADETLIRDMDDKVYEQLSNVASLPGIVGAAYAMPDAHWGYGFPIGGVAAFDAAAGGVISAGGVGFDISCGVRTVLTGVDAKEFLHVQHAIADSLQRQIPAGLGSEGAITLETADMDAMLLGGATWAVARGYGESSDLEFIEEVGCVKGARPECVSEKARKRQRREMGTLGSGNHYLEVQVVAEICDAKAARAFQLAKGEILVTIHCGSRGLGHQIGTDYLTEMLLAAESAHIALPDRELACAPIQSDVGQRYLGAMRAATNCALANRQILTHHARRVMQHYFPAAAMPLLFDVSHNTCKIETHRTGGKAKELFVHRKGATRSLGPHQEGLPEAYSESGQPVLIGGSMGTGSFVLAGLASSEGKSFSSACHGAGRAMSRHQAGRQWSGRRVVDDLAAGGILIRSPSLRGVAEEAPGAYKDVNAVVLSAERAGLAKRVARLEPVICIKG